jgi:hypothetical protein
MRPDTIAVLCCLFLAALGIGHTIATSGILLQIIAYLHEVVAYLYWNVFWEIRYQFCNDFEDVPLYIRVIVILICIHTVFVLYVHLKYAYWMKLRPEANQTVQAVQAVQIVQTVQVVQVDPGEHGEKMQSHRTKNLAIPTAAPIIPPPPMSAPPTYPPPFESPFKNFRGTGESFAHPRWNDPTQYPVFQPSTTRDEARRKERDSKLSASRQPSSVYKSTKCEKVAAAPIIPKPDVIQSATKSTTVTTKNHVVLAPAHKVVELPAIYVPAPTQAPPPVVPSAAENRAASVKALQDVEDKKHLIIAAMQLLLSTIGSEAGCEASAARILALMAAAKMHLMPFFPGGLFGLDPNFLIWKDAVVEFWCQFRPYGWEIAEDEDPRLRIFLEQYKDAAIWQGLGRHLGDLIVVAKPDPSPVQMPPQRQETTQVAHPPQSPAPSTQGFPAPKMGTQSAIPTIIVSLPAPTISFPPQPQQAPYTSAPSQQPPPQQPIGIQGAPGLLDFDSYSWCQASDDELFALTWESFRWPSAVKGQRQIWSYSSMGGLKLPEKLPEFVTAFYVKSELKKVALEFRRAAAIFRFQALDCPQPDDDDLPMIPLLSEVEEMARSAGNMMTACQESLEWDDEDPFYDAAFFFYEYVRRDRTIRRKLYAMYGGPGRDINMGQDEWDGLIQAWNVIKAKCLA